MDPQYDDLDQLDSAVLENALSSADNVSYSELMAFQQAYARPHGFISAVICSLGIIMNVVNVTVLTRPRMISAVNVTLTLIAICDVILMTTQLVTSVYERILFADECTSLERWSFVWVLYHIVHGHVTVWAHATSLWLAVVLSLARYFTLRTRGPCRWNHTGFMIKVDAAVAAACLLISFPSFLMFEIEKGHFITANLTELDYDDPARSASQPLEVDNSDPGDPISPCSAGRYISAAWLWEEMRSLNNSEEVILNSLSEVSNQTIYKQEYSRFHSEWLLKLTMWDFGILHKVAPCIVLTISMCLLINVLVEANKRRQRLLGQRAVPKGVLKRFQSRYLMVNQDRTFDKTGTFNTDRTTATLLCVVLIFVLCELPQGILIVICALSNSDPSQCHYVILGDVLDILSLINSSVNFVLYCAMSQRFRSIFAEIFITPLPFLPMMLGSKHQELTSGGQNSAVDLIVRSQASSVFRATGQAYNHYQQCFVPQNSFAEKSFAMPSVVYSDDDSGVTRTEAILVTSPNQRATRKLFTTPFSRLKSIKETSDRASESHSQSHSISANSEAKL